MTPKLHPETGLHYVVVIPDMWGPFVDYYAAYQVLMRRLSWITVIGSDKFPEVYSGLRSDPEIMFVCWEDVELPGERWKHDIFPGQPYDIDTPSDHVDPPRCLRTLVYFEAMGAPEKMLPEHVTHWKRVAIRAPLYDAIFGHTPEAAAALKRGMGLPTYVLPAGWSPEVMGVPCWSKPKVPQHSDRLVTWGSKVGRRVALLPWLDAATQPGHVLDYTGSFGRELLSWIEGHKAALYIAHSRVDSFSTWRLWQMASTSTGLIAEPGDSWPFVAGIHYAPIDWIPDDEAQRDFALAQIRRYLGEPAALHAFAERAHELAWAYTVERCVKDYLVPASAEIKARRQCT